MSANPWGMDCIELVELVTEYLENTLGAEERANFEKHLTLCGSCRHYLEQMQLTLKVTRTLRLEDVPPAALEEFRKAFLRWRK